MYGCYYSTILYGFCEDNSDYVLDAEWLYDQEKDVIEIASESVVRNHMAEACYGVRCSINANSGKIEVDDNQKKIIEAFYTRFIAYKKQNDNYDENDEYSPKLGYYNVIIGDYSVDHDSYNLDDEQPDM